METFYIIHCKFQIPHVLKQFSLLRDHDLLYDYTERNSSLETQLNNNWKGLCWKDTKMIFSYFYTYNSCFKL